VPLRGRELAGDDRGAGARAVLQDLEQITAPVVRERADGKVVEDEDVDAGEAGEEADVAPSLRKAGGVVDGDRSGYPF
jgi:hypothetical protein